MRVDAAARKVISKVISKAVTIIAAIIANRDANTRQQKRTAPGDSSRSNKIVVAEK